MELDYPLKLVKLVKLAFPHLRMRIRIRNNLSDICETFERLRQGDVVLEKEIRESNVENQRYNLQKIDSVIRLR